jgi:FKBP-type peptidyl-prolyl cis-trans isomerase FkpA
MFQRITLTFLLASISIAAIAQFKPQQKGSGLTVNPNAKPVPVPQGKPPVQIKPATAPQQNPNLVMQPQTIQAPAAISYKKINSDLQYALIVDKPTSPKPKEGDMVRLHMMSTCNNRVLYNTRNTNKNQPAEFSVNKPAFNADIISAIQMMTPGDSMICLVDANQMFANTKNKMPDFIKPGDKIQYFIKLVSIKTKEQFQKENQAKMAKQQAEMNKKMQVQMTKQQKEQQAKQRKDSIRLVGEEDAMLKEYFAKNNLNPKKTYSGMYYNLIEKGIGDMPLRGDTMVMNYSGRLLDGTPFDSNVDTSFHHVAPFEFPLGQGKVINGWDEGIAILPQGSKATLYIPSRLAYGPNARPSIPANSILIFDVELKNIKPVPVK